MGRSRKALSEGVKSEAVKHRTAGVAHITGTIMSLTGTKT